MEYAEHTFEPVFDGNSRILILGTFPSVKSREGNFYYHNPQNRFWKLLAALTQRPVPGTVPQKIAFLLDCGIAVWDVVQSCEIKGSSDASIQNVVPADISLVLKKADIRAVYGNGACACRLYSRYCLPDTGREIIRLPSTSPANAAYTLDRLIECWRVILPQIL